VERFERTILEGGLEIVSATQPGVRSVSVGCWLDVGSRDETEAQAGVAHLLEHLAFKGTPRRSALDIAEMFDSIGGDLNAFTTKEATCFHARILDTDLELAVDAIADIVQHPLLAPADVELERSVVLEEIAMHEDTPDDLVFDVFTEALLPGQAVGRRIQGFASSVAGLTREAVAAFRAERYPSARTIVAASGAIEHDHLVALVSERFDGAAPRAGLRRDDGFHPVAGVRAFATRDVEQSHLVLGVPGISRRDPRRWTLALLNAALGGGSSSRLFQRIREERGLAYHVSSGNQAFTGGGIFTIYAGCAPERIGEVAALAREIVAEVVADGITEAELARARGYLRGGLVLGFEEPGGAMTHLGKSALLLGEILTPAQLLERIDAVTLEDCGALAQELLGSVAWSVAVVGHDPDPPVDAFDPREAAA
jgi:predicted Zn-dependent peptidase